MRRAVIYRRVEYVQVCVCGQWKAAIHVCYKRNDFDCNDNHRYLCGRCAENDAEVIMLRLARIVDVEAS